MLRVMVVVWMFVVACGDPPPLTVSGQVTLACSSNCKVGEVHQGLLELDSNEAILADVEETNSPREDDLIQFSLAETGPFVQEGYETYEIPFGPSQTEFFYRCLHVGSGAIRNNVVLSDDVTSVLEVITPITCVDAPPPDIEVRGPNGGVIPDLGTDAAGVKVHGVQFTREYTIKNIGTGPLTLMTASFGAGNNCVGTVLVQPNPMTLAPGATGTMTVGVTPTAPGPFDVLWAITSSDPDENPYTVEISGQAPAGDIAISAPSTGAITDGGTQNVGSKPAGVAFTETYRIDNDGLAFLTVGQATIGTLVNCSVSITTQPITTPLPPQTVGATSLALSITPLAGGAFTCNVSVPSTDPDAENPYTWTISGTATEPEIDVSGFADGASDPVGDVRTGAAFSRSYTIMNTGSATLHISSVALGTATKCTLAVSMAPAMTVAPAGSTMVTVSVTPTADGAFTCPFTIMNDDGDEALYDLSVTGNAVSPRITLEGPGGMIADMGTDNAGGGHPATVAFSRTYTIRNPGTAPLVISGVVIDTPSCNNCVDVITQPALTTVPPGGSTTFSIQLTPTAAGSFSHSYRINTDAGASPYLFAVSGIATSAPAPSIQVSRSGIDVGPMTTDSLGTFSSTAPIELDYTISNSGMANLVVTGVDSPGMPGCTNCTVVVSGGTGTVIPGGSTTFHVTVTPTGTGSFNFQLRIASNDPVFPLGYLFGVSGVAQLPPEIDVPGFPSGNSDDVGSVPAGTPFVRTYTVKNTGGGTLTLSGPTFVTTNCSASISTAPATSVAPGGMTTFSVTVTPTAAGSFLCRILLGNNDTTDAESPYDIAITGTAAANIGNFGSMLGNYFGDSGCGIQDWSLKNVNGLKVDSFGSNPNDFPFAVGADPNVATATLLTIFGAPNHTCTLTKSGNFTITIHCTNTSGGQCTEVASKI